MNLTDAHLFAHDTDEQRYHYLGEGDVSATPPKPTQPDDIEGTIELKRPYPTGVFFDEAGAPKMVDLIAANEEKVLHIENVAASPLHPPWDLEFIAMQYRLDHEWLPEERREGADDDHRTVEVELDGLGPFESGEITFDVETEVRGMVAHVDIDLVSFEAEAEAGGGTWRLNADF